MEYGLLTSRGPPVVTLQEGGIASGRPSTTVSMEHERRDRTARSATSTTTPSNVSNPLSEAEPRQEEKAQVDVQHQGVRREREAARPSTLGNVSRRISVYDIFGYRSLRRPLALFLAEHEGDETVSLLTQTWNAFHRDDTSTLQPSMSRGHCPYGGHTCPTCERYHVCMDCMRCPRGTPPDNRCDGSNHCIEACPVLLIDYVVDPNSDY
jgi:hypothetical protein